MIDPFAAFGQPDVPADEGESLLLAEETRSRDLDVLFNLELFDDGVVPPMPFLAGDTGLPFWYEPWLPGTPPGYESNTSGQFFIDPTTSRERGSFADDEAPHPTYYSRYHKSSRLCSVCHDSSNPILASLFIGVEVPERRSASSYYQIQRTASEFSLGAFGRPGGAESVLDGIPWAAACQDCHMKDVSGSATGPRKNAPLRTDHPRHEFMGGNHWILKILGTLDESRIYFDEYNLRILSGEKYAGARIDVASLKDIGHLLWERADDQSSRKLSAAVSLQEFSPEDEGHIYLRVINNTGHKLPSGFPAGKRMFLNVVFFDSEGAALGEINPYEELVTYRDSHGNDVYVSGGDIGSREEGLIWEQVLASDLTGEEETFHYLLATSRSKDNRIPPKGFDSSARMRDRISQPRWTGSLPGGDDCEASGEAGDCSNYFTPEEYAGGYDDVVIVKIPGTFTWRATLYYQCPTRAFVEFLRQEIDGTAATLTEPTWAQLYDMNPDSDPAYLIQTDKYFENLKGWGRAIWDLWLHNGGAKPVAMKWLGVPPEACVAESPAGLDVEPGRSALTLRWDPVPDTLWYYVYRVEDGSYRRLGWSASEYYLDSKLTPGVESCYVVTSYSECGLQSDASGRICGTPTRQ
ncbi:MAG: hypothetical protein ACWGSD_14975, partial [Thermodesulfobacteriota bacterium]